MTAFSITGVVLAAGAGSRFGMPKALAITGDGVPWIERATSTLLDAGCHRVVVVLGAAAQTASTLVPRDSRITTVLFENWSAGMAGSVRAGLAAASGDAVVVTLVDVPDLPVEVVRRVLDAGAAAGTDSTGGTDGVSDALLQAVFNGRPGHPVVIGKNHWGVLTKWLETAVDSDSGARRYLSSHGVTEVECGDLSSGDDIDTPSEMPGGTTAFG
ncbi:MAG: nucleotidyltransferase family protein [Microbacteriaceae bacterium]